MVFAYNHFRDVGAGLVPTGGRAQDCGSGFLAITGPQRVFFIWMTTMKQGMRYVVQHHKRKQKSERKVKGNGSEAEADPPLSLPLHLVLLHPLLQGLLPGLLPHRAEAVQVAEVGLFC
ncbi:hypothetical protein Chor_006259 [Crotalus horridus]